MRCGVFYPLLMPFKLKYKIKFIKQIILDKASSALLLDEK